MSAVLAPKQLPAMIGAAFEGGFFFGLILVDGRQHAIIVAPKAEGEHKAAPWNKAMKRIDGALSYNDSFANTKAMAEAGSAIAKWAREQRIGGFEDWCIPARDVLELMYRHGKPHADENATYYRSGENPSSVPVGYPYTEALPAQTEVEAFRTGGAEALDETGYWSSTQCEAGNGYAWAQSFDNGGQDGCHKGGNSCRVRLVRTIAI